MFATPKELLSTGEEEEDEDKFHLVNLPAVTRARACQEIVEKTTTKCRRRRKKKVDYLHLPSPFLSISLSLSLSLSLLT